MHVLGMCVLNIVAIAIAKGDVQPIWHVPIQVSFKVCLRLLYGSNVSAWL